MRVLSLTALLPAGATLYFFVFWRWFGFWRRHAVATYTMMLGTFVGLGAAAHAFRDHVFAHRLAMPLACRVVGWTIVGLSGVLALVADRQLGLRVRAFRPFFDDAGRIELQTTGAYALVRHPIYSAGIGYQLGVFLVAGHLSVLAAAVVFAVGAVWFTRQEERRLVELLDDPASYQRYRAEVPALFPWTGGARRRPRR